MKKIFFLLFACSSFLMGIDGWGLLVEAEEAITSPAVMINFQKGCLVSIRKANVTEETLRNLIEGVLFRKYLKYGNDNTGVEFYMLDQITDPECFNFAMSQCLKAFVKLTKPWLCRYITGFSHTLMDRWASARNKQNSILLNMKWRANRDRGILTVLGSIFRGKTWEVNDLEKFIKTPEQLKELVLDLVYYVRDCQHTHFSE